MGIVWETISTLIGDLQPIGPMCQLTLHVVGFDRNDLLRALEQVEIDSSLTADHVCELCDEQNDF